MQRVQASMPSPPSMLSNLGATLHSRSAHRRNVSGELDVFEATKYFSDPIDSFSFSSHVVTNEERMMALDKPQESHKVERHSKEKSCKQSSSPAARLASFLNSFFGQTASKRKPKSISTPSSAKSMINPSLGGRKRRSSESKSIHSSASTCGFRTPSLYPNTPAAKADNNTTMQQLKSVSFCPQSEAWKEKSGGFFDRSKTLERVHKIHGTDGFVGNKWVLNKASSNYGFMRAGDQFIIPSRVRKSFRRRSKEYYYNDDDGRSDASSDLFELKNMDLGDELPVYGTTRVEIIRRGSAIAIGAK